MSKTLFNTSDSLKPISTSTFPANVATTLVTGSSNAGEPGKSSTATVHDLVGVAILVVPPGARAALGEQYLLTSALELETKDIVVIAREEGVVAYIHLPIIVKEMKYPSTELQTGMVLHDITGKYARQKEEETAQDKPDAPPKPTSNSKAKPKVKSKATKPADKGGLHA